MSTYEPYRKWLSPACGLGYCPLGFRHVGWSTAFHRGLEYRLCIACAYGLEYCLSRTHLSCAHIRYISAAVFSFNLYEPNSSSKKPFLFPLGSIFVSSQWQEHLTRLPQLWACWQDAHEALRIYLPLMVVIMTASTLILTIVQSRYCQAASV